MTESMFRLRHIGKNHVRTPEGHDLGPVEDFLLDAANGAVAYVVISHGAGLLGTGGKLYAIPWHRLSIDPVTEALLAQTDEQALEESGAFTEDQWPDLRDARFHERMQRVYGAERPPNAGPSDGRETYGSAGSETAGTGNWVNNEKRRY
ncbi:MAG: PRC-barrel domain-containing protein [Bryobacteraceae bacterium]|nr:PRC-barrel domain-containing protein [Bryobacteraceae bacterium]